MLYRGGYCVICTGQASVQSYIDVLNFQVIDSHSEDVVYLTDHPCSTSLMPECCQLGIKHSQNDCNQVALGV